MFGREYFASNKFDVKCKLSVRNLDDFIQYFVSTRSSKSDFGHDDATFEMC